MAVDIPGLIGVTVFYILILVAGMVAWRKSRKTLTSDETFVANRNLGLWLSYFTLTATTIGAGAINGAAESMAFSGLLWTCVPILYNVSMAITGFVYAPKLRRGGYVTMFDPIGLKLGKRIGGLLVIPDLFSDWFWAAAILSALGSTMALILGLNSDLCVILSTGIAVIYTLFGGLYSVAYTDVIQFIFLVVGMLVAFPFIFYHPSVDLSSVQGTWVGVIPTNSIGPYADLCLQITMAGFGWQVYYQRALACKSVRLVPIMTLLAAITSLMFLIPSLTIGVVGSATDWNATDYDGPIPIPKDQHRYILPMVLKYLCPRPVAVVGIAAVAAAAMSSADSAILAAGTVFAKNVYKDIFRQNASGREVLWAMRVGVLVSGGFACVVAIWVKTVYGLYHLCSDFGYVLIVPQMTCVLWVKVSNGYGSVTAFFISLFLRIAAGDPLLRIPVLIKFPFYSETDGQLFPFRTFSMLVNFTVLISVSWLTQLVFTKGWLPRKWDFLRAVKFDEEKTGKSEVDDKLMTETELSEGNQN